MVDNITKYKDFSIRISVKERVILGVIFWSIGFLFNSILHNYYPFFQEWVFDTYCVGDFFYITGYSFFLSVLLDKQRNLNRRILIGLFIWCVGYVCNYFLYPRFGFFRDWIWHVYSIGDCLYTFAYSLILSSIWGGEKDEK